ncbi:methyl-accepting chemotaxis protein [Bradyrhizobium sp. 187]|uniref:HAMP domain-containing methyl-accepting chemotaxis protein n=1 Tax=Bradyrhizobium sp. 187 TaxID=2782655 RepID=UPI001FFEE359|nr:methyl-accepting chemotaxis protein [Bradyrhizobium sp. 187]UPJ71841.1 HAMP domain-containing protein [Bradyrhizobium sp. 187]
MSFFNLRIRGRLYGGFGALVLFAVALAGFAVWQLWAIQAQVDTMTMQSRNALRAGEIGSELQAFRRSVLRYIFDQDETAFAETEKRLARTADLLQEAGNTAKLEERRAMYRAASNAVAELKTKRAALGDAIKQMLTGRELLFAEGEKMRADLEKLLEAAEKTPFAQGADTLESRILQVRVANWRMLATRDQKGISAFKACVEKARHQIAELEKADLPPNLAAMLGTVKAGIGGYSDAFEKTSTNLLLGDELYYKFIVPTVMKTTGDMDFAKADIGERFTKESRETEGRISGSVTMQEIVTGFAALVGVLIAFFIGRSIIGPLSGLTSSMLTLANGKFDVVVPGIGRKDEVGEMARTVEIFKKNGLEVERLKAEQQEAEFRTALQRKADMHRLADDFENAVGDIVNNVSSASTQLEASAGTLTTTAKRSQEVSTRVAAASEEASANVQSVASATEELSSSVNEISRQVQESARIASDAVGQARSTTDRVSALSKAATRIGDVIELINSIAGQTNLLALNATIEAARAGEAGRGFAVVASEVKALAEQTAKATGEIGQQINGIQAATQDSVNAIKEISSTIERLSEISSTIAAAVEEQGAATQEISRNVQQAAQGTEQVSSNITDVERGTAETGSASSQVLSAAKMLAGDSKRLKTEVSKFLTSVRTA